MNRHVAATAHAHALYPHPDTPAGAVSDLTVEMARDGARLSLRYRLAGDLAALVLPPPTKPARTDGLWKHSCFEAFVAVDGEEGYSEFNFAPSGAWAAYRFDDYRTGMRDAVVDAPIIGPKPGGGFALEASCDTGLDADRPWRVAVSAVIEEQDGRRSYWALAHLPGKPDFHHRDCFVLQLPPAGEK